VPKLLRACCENFFVVGVAGQGKNEPVVNQVFGLGFINQFSADYTSEPFVRIFDEVSPDPSDVLVIEGILRAFIRGNGFSDKGEIAVPDSFDEDFLFEDFGVCFYHFGLVRRQKFEGMVQVIHFDNLAKGNHRTVRRNGGPGGGFFGGDLCKSAGIPVNDKQSAFFAIDACGTVCRPLEGVRWVTAGKENYGDTEGGKAPGYLSISHNVSP
jgi:hypothetical protein